MVELRMCRFCFDETSTVQNPLWSPCDCRGSVKYIHRDCLRHWRAVAESVQFKTHCQLCGTAFRIPRRWPAEEFPSDAELRTGIWPFLAKPIYPMLLVFYLHIAYLMFHMKRLMETAVPYYDVLHPVLPNSHILSRVMGLGEVQLIVAGLLAIVTIAYGAFYTRLLARVRNKWMYATYIFSMDDTERVLLTPFLWLTLLGFTGFLAVLFPLPCISFYVALLPYYMRVHCEILNDMNARGES